MTTHYLDNMGRVKDMEAQNTELEKLKEEAIEKGDKNLARLYDNQINANNNGMTGFINWNSPDD